MAAQDGVAFGKDFGQPVNIRPVGRDHHHRPRPQIGLQIGQGALTIGQWVAFAFVPAVKPDLITDTLAKLEKQQAGDVQGFRHVPEMRRRRRRIVLAPVDGAEKGGVREGDHPCSPSNSAARMSATSLAEKTRSPQVCFKRARMSGLTSLVSLGGAGGRRRAKTLPDLVICHRLALGNPRREYRAKRLRKSLTEAVFIVRQICITAPNLSRAMQAGKAKPRASELSWRGHQSAGEKSNQGLKFLRPYSDTVLSQYSYDETSDFKSTEAVSLGAVATGISFDLEAAQLGSRRHHWPMRLLLWRGRGALRGAVGGREGP